MIQKSANKVLKGLWYQVDSNDNYWPQYKESKDKNWFYEGRKVARKLLKRGLTDHLNSLEIRRAQREMRETYKIAHRAANIRLENGVCVAVDSEPEMEPCVDCDFILFCRAKSFTCQYYRSWTRLRVPRVVKKWPDKTWDEWKHEEEFDELLQYGK